MNKETTGIILTEQFFLTTNLLSDSTTITNKYIQIIELKFKLNLNRTNKEIQITKLNNQLNLKLNLTILQPR